MDPNGASGSNGANGASDSNNANGANRVNGLNGEMGRIGENFDASLMGRREDDFDSRSGSENFDASGDEADAGDDQQQNKRKKKFHRHTPQQIQELEKYVFITIMQSFYSNVIDYLWFKYSICL
jgi:hypothetical protein